MSANRRYRQGAQVGPTGRSRELAWYVSEVDASLILPASYATSVETAILRDNYA
jgi:hypothetical protein